MEKEYLSFSESGFHLPQEEVLEKTNDQKKLSIGIPKEILLQEKRVSLAPDSVALLVNHGHNVIIQRGAGISCSFLDLEYSEAGAQIVNDAREVFESDIILKVSPPNLEELDMMKNGKTLISSLQLKLQKKEYFQKLINKKTTAIAFDYIKDPEGIFPVVRSMSEIAGNASVLIAAECLSNFNGGKGLLLGGIAGVSTTNILIIGAGTVGEFAARSAKALGCSVKIFDTSLYKLRRIQDKLGQRLDTSMIHPKALQKAIRRADVVIGAIRVKDERTPCVVSEEMVKMMKPLSVIVDVSIDRGGCFETSEPTTHNNPTFEKHGVIHYCVPNIPSRMARTASFAFSNIFSSLLLKIANFGGVKSTIIQNENISQGVYVINGNLTNKVIGEWYNLPYKTLK
jgi:alanine dehydrogenase